MSELDNLKLYANWEEERNLFGWRISGIFIWQYIRFGVFGIIDSKLRKLKNHTYYNYIYERTEKLFPRILKELPHKILGQRDILFANMNKRQEIDGLYYSPYLDGLLEKLEFSYYVLEAGRIENSNKIVTKNCLIYSPLNLATGIVTNRYVEERVGKLLNIIEKDFSIKLDNADKNYITSNIYSVIQNRKVYKSYYRYLLTIIRPKVLVINGAALQYHRYLIEVAKEMKIPVVEYEHGLGNACCMEDFYKKKRYLSTYPDYRWTYSRETIYSYRLPISDDKIVSVGNAFHDIRKTQLLNSVTDSNIKEILVISDYETESKLDEFAVKLSATLDSNKYKVIFKLHPGEVNWREKYPILLNSKVSVAGERNEKDINYYIAKSEYVVGTNSTALAEAVELNKPVYIYTKADNSIFSEYLYINNHAFCIEGVKEFGELINSGKRDIFNTNIYEKNPVKRINCELRKLMQ